MSKTSFFTSRCRLILCCVVAHIILFFTFQQNALASGSCQGRFVDPITDVCWSCLFPISIGSVDVVNGDVSDTSNPSLPVCMCEFPIVHVGLTVGFWEPFAMTDVTRTPFCMVTLGGVQLSGDLFGMGESEVSNTDANNSFYYVHWYKYPLLYWLNIITDWMCLETGDLDIAYLTELDPSWNDDEWTFLLNPEAILFGNIISQSACSADAMAASVSLPLDSLFWCAGAQGSMYPMNGHVQEHIGGVQASTLLTERMAYKLHRELLIVDSVPENSPAICEEYHETIMPKSRYRYQMVSPVPTTGGGGCHPFGATTSIWGSGHEYPFQGEDFGYLVWRKRNCCSF